MRIGRTLPPAAAPLQLTDIISGVTALLSGDNAIEKFEQELREFFLVKYCFTVSSGKAALSLVLEALHKILPQKNEVLIPAYTCASVPSAVVRANLKVRVCDVGWESFDFDYQQLQRETENPRLLCVVPTHLFGIPAEVERLKALVKEKRMYVVEDAAQCMGTESNGVLLGTVGDAGIFSMGRGKAFSTFGGGIIITNNELIGEQIKTRLDKVSPATISDSVVSLICAISVAILIHPAIYWLPNSLPFLKLGETKFEPSFSIRRLSLAQAGMAKAWKERIRNFLINRRKNAEIISSYGIRPAGVKANNLPDMIRFPLLLEDRFHKEAVMQDNRKCGLGLSGAYPDTFAGIANLTGIEKDRAVNAINLAERVITLPVHPLVKKKDLSKILALLNQHSQYKEWCS